LKSSAASERLTGGAPPGAEKIAMGVFDWIQDIDTARGMVDPGFKNSKNAKKFMGSWSVTIGTVITGNYGTTLQSYYGPYITHVVDTGMLGLGYWAGQYLNELGLPTFIAPEGTFSQFGNNFLASLLGGIGGFVTWVYGPNITVNYGGPAGTITRAKMFKKTAYTSEKGKFGIPLGLVGKDIKLTPAGAPPEGVLATEMATADKKILEAVNLLSILLNYTVAILELTAKFAYSSFHSADPKDPTDNDTLEQHDPSEDDYPLSAIDFVVGALPPRIMAMIYTIETAGSFEFWGTATASKLKAFVERITNALHVSPDPTSWFAYSQATAEQCKKSSMDSIEAVVGTAATLMIVLGLVLTAV
jgi:hypothetical protein